MKTLLATVCISLLFTVNSKAQEREMKVIDLPNSSKTTNRDKDKARGEISEKQVEEFRKRQQEREKETKVYNVAHVDVPAEFPGGMIAFDKQLIANIELMDVETDIKSLTVIVSFIVEKDGTLSNIVVLRDPGYGVGKRTASALQLLPKWKPAKKEEEIVRSQLTVPLSIPIKK